PALSRVLLACLGPYTDKRQQQNPTAFNILKDAVYFELKTLPELAREKPEKLRDFLPDNVSFDEAKSTLTHTYRLGRQTATDHALLELKPVSLLDPSLRAAQPKSESGDRLRSRRMRKPIPGR